MQAAGADLWMVLLAEVDRCSRGLTAAIGNTAFGPFAVFVLQLLL